MTVFFSHTSLLTVWRSYVVELLCMKSVVLFVCRLILVASPHEVASDKIFFRDYESGSRPLFVISSVSWRSGWRDIGKSSKSPKSPNPNF